MRRTGCRNHAAYRIVAADSRSSRERMIFGLLACALASACLAAAPADGEADRTVRFGVAYYPEAWPEERWAQDLDDMKAIGIDHIRIGEFNWSGFEPREGVFDFVPYRRLLALCEEKGVGVMMCTPSAALPPWMTAKYAVERETRERHGVAIGCRQTRCPSRAKFRFFADRMAAKMAEAFKEFKCIRYWQIDNEVHITAGYDECCCLECEKKFQLWLKARYGTVEKMNRAWNHAFWSGRFDDFAEVRLPIHKGRPWFLEYVRFQSDNFKDFILGQAAAIRRVIPRAVITSNGSEMSGWIRLDEMYSSLGYAATDTYASEESRGRSVWMWGLSRGVTGTQKPFMIAETGPFNWKFDEKNGDDIIFGWIDEAVRRGAREIFFFRWRQSVSGEEDHPAILPWSGKKGSTYERVRRLIADWRVKEAKSGALPLPQSGVAILHSNASDQDFLVRTRNFQFGPYENLHILLDERLSARGIVPDYVMSGEGLDLSGYRILFVPLNCIVPRTVQDALRTFVNGGGRLVAISRMNNVDPKGGAYLTEPYPAGMTDLFGMEVNETRFASDGNYVCDRVEPKGCIVLSRLTDGVFAGEPDLVLHRVGNGDSYYKALVPRTPAEIDVLLDRVLRN